MSEIGDRYRRIIGIVVFGAWLASLALPIETECGSSYIIPGYLVGLIGWLGPLDGQFGWYANLFMLWQVGRLLLGRHAGIIGSLIALVLALNAFLWKTIPMDVGRSTMCERQPGFYVWIACAVLVAAVAVCDRLIFGNTKSGEET